MKAVTQIGLLVVLGAVAVGGYYGWETYSTAEQDIEASPSRNERRVVSVEAVPASYRDLNVVVESVGSTLALRSVEITPLASGRVTKVGFSSGDLVKAGADLLRLDDVIQQADVVEAKARLQEATNTLKRSQTLKRQNAASVAAVESLVAKSAIAKADLDRAAQRLRDRVVIAPFSGIVGFSSVEPGARIDVGSVVTVLDDLSSVIVEFSLPESLFGTVGLGKRVVAAATPFPGRVFSGTIDTVGSRIDPVSRSFKARARIANGDRALAAGMFVHLSVILDTKKALAVPEEAIIADGNRPYIYVVEKAGDKQRISQRFITIGRRSFGFAEITQGVVENEPVVVRGVQKVKDGAVVTIKGQSSPEGSKGKGASKNKPGASKKRGDGTGS